MDQSALTPGQYRVGIGLGSFMLLSGAALLFFGISFLKQAHASQGWPVSPGIVKAVKIVRDRASSSTGTSSRVYTYYYTVDYTYEVEGRPYRGDRYSLGSGSTASKRYPDRSQAVEAAQRNHPTGKSVDVYYDPAHPDSAVLNPGANWGTYVPLIMGIIVCPSGLILLYVAFSRNTLSG